MMLLSQYACSQTYTIQFVDQSNKVLKSITKELNDNEKCFSFDEKEKTDIQKLQLSRGHVYVIQNDILIRQYSVISIVESEIFDVEHLLLCDEKGSIRFEEDMICVK